MKVAGNNYRKIRLSSGEMRDETKDDQAVGFYDSDKGEIGVIKATVERERRILWHEVVHIFDETMLIGLDEAQTNMLAMLIDCAIQDNEELR